MIATKIIGLLKLLKVNMRLLPVQFLRWLWYMNYQIHSSCKNEWPLTLLSYLVEIQNTLTIPEFLFDARS